MFKKEIGILLFILILGGILRIWSITSTPPSLNWDEVSHGYNAYSILKTGKDEWGKAFPLTNFRAYGDYPLPLNLYLTIPFIATLGLNEFAVRLPHALLGIGTIVGVYFLVLGLVKKKNLALLAAFLVAVTPWYVFTSRFVLQSNLAVFFLTTGMALFFNRERGKWFLPLAFACLGLTLYGYHTTRIFTPFLLGVMLFIYRKEIVTKMALVILAIFLLPLPFILMNPEARARSREVFLVDAGMVARIIEARQASKLPAGITRLIHNRPTYFAVNFAKNYLDYFSPEFLFFKGGTQYQFSVPGRGLLYPVMLPLFYLGLVSLVIRSLKSKDYQLVLAWLLLAPIPAAITREQFAVLRATPMLPVTEILVVMGAGVVIGFLEKRRLRILRNILVIGFSAAIFLLAEEYFIKYFTDYRRDYSWSWQYGYKEAVAYAKENYDEYDKIIVTKKYGEPHEFFLFYGASTSESWAEPMGFQNNKNLIRFFQSNWYWVDGFDKFYFVNDWQAKDLITESKVKIDCTNVKCLLITSPNNTPGGWNKIKQIDFLDGKAAFEIYEN